MNLAAVIVPGTTTPRTTNQQRSSLALDAYNAIWCTKSSNIWLGDLFRNTWEWAKTPPLRGDGTCTFPQ